MPPDFYSDRDKEIYEQYQFIPQEKYLSTPFQLPEPPGAEPPESGSGISTLPVYMGGGSGGAPADVSNLLFDYQNAINKRQRLLENPGTFAQKIYDMGFPKQRSVEQMMRDAGEYNRGIMASRPDSPLNQKIMDYIKANPTKKFSVDPDFGEMSFGKQLNKYTDDEFREANPELFVQQGMFEDPLDVRTQLPFGATGILQAVLPDSYYSKMTMPQQIYTQSQMGYTGPTIFGENNTGLPKDVFGRNVRSAFGNYAEKQQKDIDKLDDYFSSDAFSKKYGETELVQDEFGNFTFQNLINPALAAKANQMNKLNLTRYNYDKKGLQELKGIEDQTGFTGIMEAENVGYTPYGITQGVSDADYTGGGNIDRAIDRARERSDATTPDDFGQSEGMVDGWED